MGQRLTSPDEGRREIRHGAVSLLLVAAAFGVLIISIVAESGLLAWVGLMSVGAALGYLIGADPR